MRIKYQDFNFRPDSLKVIDQANDILTQYANRGIIVTLRQLYYQFVSRDLIPNKQTEYKRLGSIINDARLAGLIDWNHMQDRTRNLQSLAHWSSPGGVIQSASQSYHRNLWDGQENYVEVWIEKDALVGVIEGACEKWDVPFFSCRGYTSQSEMWAASQRLLKQAIAGRSCHIIHLGDHDPSGKDMSRDIEERMKMFMHRDYARDYFRKNRMKTGETEEQWKERVGQELMTSDRYVNIIELDRIALNMDQIEQYNPPPNPAKITDSRATAYIEEYGEESWELDALDPDVMVDLIESAITSRLDVDLWEEKRQQQEHERVVLTKASERWDEVAEFLQDGTEE